MTDVADTARNLEAQAALYGAPIGDLLRRYGQVLGVTQGRLAELLGVSAPMLSQLVNGRRVRLGNPASVQRLQAMHRAVQDVEGGGEVATALADLERNRLSDVFTATTRTADDEVRRLFATAGSAEDLAAAALLLEADFPRIAALLREQSGRGGGAPGR